MSKSESGVEEIGQGDNLVKRLKKYKLVFVVYKKL